MNILYNTEQMAPLLALNQIKKEVNAFKLINR